MVNFDVRQLEYFVVAARLGSYSQAAHELFVTPQAVSHGIQLLEARIGNKLFTRVSNGVALTDFGAGFLGQAQKVLDELDRLQALVDRHRQEGHPGLVVGIHPLCFEENGGTLNRNVLLAFQRQHGPDSVAYVEMNGSAITEALLKGSIDLGISVPPENADEAFDLRPLKRFAIAAIASRRFPGHFAPCDDAVSINELSQGALVLFTEETAYNDCLLEEACREGCDLPIASMRVHAHGDMGFLAGHQLYVVRPLQHALRTVHDGRLRVIPILDGTGSRIEMPLAILNKRGHTPSAIEEEFCELVQKRYRDAPAA